MRRLAAVAALALLGLAPASARADQSDNVQSVASLPALKSAISINFIGDSMFVSTASGLYAYDVSQPAEPRLLSALTIPVWENEDVDLDPVRKRLFVSRDPRGFTSPAVPGSVFPYGAVHVIDVSDPSDMRQLNFFLVPAGHTTTCVNRCDFVWTAGPGASVTTQPSDWEGRPIFATDVRDPMDPEALPAPDRHRSRRRHDGLRPRRAGRRCRRRLGLGPGRRARLLDRGAPPRPGQRPGDDRDGAATRCPTRAAGPRGGDALTLHAQRVARLHAAAAARQVTPGQGARALAGDAATSPAGGRGGGVPRRGARLSRRRPSRRPLPR